MLAPKTAFAPPSSGSGTSMSSVISPNSSSINARRAPAVAANQAFNSPTDSEFSEDYDGPDSVRNWNEEQVCEYLRAIRCGEYANIFLSNHIDGENLLELDKDVLREMGIEKVGDRVRLFLGIKKLRTKAYAHHKKRNRVSFHRLGWAAHLPVVYKAHSLTRIRGFICAA